MIPAYNESERIVPTIASIAAHLASTDLTWELVVADDGSTDGMADLLIGLGLANLRVVGAGYNEGKGAAVRRGLRAARGRAVLFTDADMSTPIDELDVMLARLGEGADVVIGSRHADGGSTAARSNLRRLMSWGLQLLVRLLLPTSVADTQCGFKLFTREAAVTLFGAGRVDGFSFDAELLFLAARFGLRVDEVPVEWFDAPGSKVRPGRVAAGFLADLAAVRWSALRGRYPATAAEVRPTRPSMAVVTALPPSTATLTEYGEHLVAGLSVKPELGDLTVYAEDSNGVPAGAEGVRVVAGWTFGSVATPWRILRRVRRERPDVVLFNVHFASFGGSKVPAALGLLTPALVTRLTPARSVVLLHNIVDTVDLDAAGFGSGRAVTAVLTAIGRGLTRALLLADRVVTTMPAYVDVLRERYGATNVYLTPHGTFEAPADPIEEQLAGPFRILAFGKFGTYKRVDDLVAAHRLLLERGYDTECVIAGTDSPNAPGYLEGVRAANADVAGLRFTGYVEEADVASIFTDANVVVFPYTSTTGSSGPLHQTGSYARAAVVPQVGDFVDLVAREGFDAAPFEPGDVESLAAAIAGLADDPVRRRAMGRRNHAAACSLPLEHVVDWHLGHVEELLAAR